MFDRPATTGDAVRDAHELIGRFIRIDRIGVIIGVLLVVVANGAFVREPAVWWALVPLAFLGVALTVALQRLAPGDLTVSLALVTVGNWVVAIAISVLFPFIWPVMVLTAIMPLLLATPYLSSPMLVITTGAASFVGGVVAITGLLSDDVGVLPDIDDVAEVVLVAGALIAHMVPMALIVRQQKSIQSAALDEAEQLNADLRASERELAASRRRIIESGDRERVRIERDLHDGAQQRLVAVRLRLELLAEQVDAESGSSVSALADEVGAALSELRELAHGIHPPVLESGGLVEGIGALIRRAPGRVEFSNHNVGRYDPSVETAVYFTAAEALTNIAKHAADAAVQVTLRDAESNGGGDRVLELTITDDGPGFDPLAPTASRGLVNVTDRIGAVGGTVRIDSSPGNGTTMSVIVPTPVHAP